MLRYNLHAVRVILSSIQFFVFPQLHIVCKHSHDHDKARCCHPPQQSSLLPLCSQLLPVPGLATHLFSVFIVLSFPEYHIPAYLGDTAVLGHCNKTNITIKKVTKIWRCIQKLCLYYNVAYMHLILCNSMSKKICACVLSHFSHVRLFVYIP